MRPSYVIAVAFAGVIFAPTPLFATPDFPDALASDLHIASSPACALCHTTGDVGGLGTVNTPFGKSMRAQGLIAYDEQSLSAALATADEDHIDSDGDCVSDIDELRRGTDPNSAASKSGACSPPPTAVTSGVDEPRYGCGASIAPRRRVPSDGVLAVIVGCAALALRKRRSARRAKLI